jgi:hypothetical protein
MEIQNSSSAYLNFPDKVRLAIDLLVSTESVSNEEILNLFINNNIDPLSANEILNFLPIALVRRMFPQVKWRDIYVEIRGPGEQTEKKYSDSFTYNIISEIAEWYCTTSPGSEAILKIAGRSAEFQAINNLLNQDSSIKLEEIKLTETFIPYDKN